MKKEEKPEVMVDLGEVLSFIEKYADNTENNCKIAASYGNYGEAFIDENISSFLRDVFMDDLGYYFSLVEEQTK